MNYQGKALKSTGVKVIEGQVLVTSAPITLLGFVDAQTGKIMERDHELFGETIAGKILVFPRGVGSTVGPYVLINLVRNEMAPLAIINRESDQGTISGCSVAGIPLGYGFNGDPTEFLKTGNHVRMTIKEGKCVLEIS